MTTEEPSFLMFARANARDSLPTSPLVVKALVDHIDALTKRLENSRTSGTNDTTANLPRMSHVRWINVSHDDEGKVSGYDPVRCDCPAPWAHQP